MLSRHPGRPTGWWTDAVDRYLASDPGGERFRSAVNVVVAWVLAVGVAALLEAQTHAFEVGSNVPDSGAINHMQRLVVLMIGSTVALTANFVVADARVRPRAVTSLMAAAGLWAGITLAVAVHGNRAVSLTLLVIVPSAGAWFRRYGARGFASSFTVYVGYLIGFLVATQVGTGRLGWTAAVIGVSAAATYLVGLVFLPGHARAPERMLRTYQSRARRVLTLTAAVMSAQQPALEAKLRRRLRRHMIRLNEAALVVDVQLAAHCSADGDILRHTVFEHESAVLTLARLAQTDAHARLSADAKRFALAVVDAALRADAGDAVRLANESIGRDDEAWPDSDLEIRERYAEATRALASALGGDLRDADVHRPVRPADDEHLRRNVVLIGGWLPGAAILNSVASVTRGSSWQDRLPLPVSSRVAIQMAVSLALAITFADLISADHILWAVIAVYVTFLGSASGHEQSFKAGLRVIGTLAGVIIGGELAYVTAPHAWATLLVMAAAVFFMIYFGKVNYALVVFAATIGVAQFYGQVGALTDNLLATRVAVTAVGAGCAIAVGLLVLPLRSAHTATVAVARYFRALSELLDNIAESATHAGTHRHTTDTRVLDGGFHAATAALRPLTRAFPGLPRPGCVRVLRLVNISHELGRTLAHDSVLAANAGRDLTPISELSKRTACVARMVADDLELPTHERSNGSVAAKQPVVSSTRPSTIGLNTEVEALASIVDELASLRGLTMPAPAP